MRSVITHFYNEAYLLPWWLKHHVELFDHGVLINHNSTDDSLEICRELAPHWNIVNSKLTDFDAYLNDFEVMKYEEGLPGFKIALTTTEFLIPGVPLAEIEGRIMHENFQAVGLSGAFMVDVEPSVEPSPDAPLVQQKRFGFLERDHPEALKPGNGYNRIYHRAPVGQYLPGRHSSYLYGADARMDDVFIFKYAYSPWNAKMKARKTQIGARIPQTDRQRTWGWQHLRNEESLEEDYRKKLVLAGDLGLNAAVARALKLPQPPSQPAAAKAEAQPEPEPEPAPARPPSAAGWMARTELKRIS
jgi:hypothetical protein